MTSLGDRMKGYEHCYSIQLPNKVPVIIRLDGKAFHTVTRGCNKPFDSELIEAMQKTMIRLVNEVQGAVFAYTQSDEISILINNYQSLEFDPYFGNKLQKLVSISASIATQEFNKQFKKDALFDSRAFILPKEEVVNYFIWRQQDWERNSLNMFARSFFSHKQLQGKNRSEVHEMLHEIGENWTELPLVCKNGSTTDKGIASEGCAVGALIFTQNRDSIEDWVAYTNTL